MGFNSLKGVILKSMVPGFAASYFHLLLSTMQNDFVRNGGSSGNRDSFSNSSLGFYQKKPPGFT